MNWNDYKQRISIMQVAVKLGYKFDRSKGLTQPHFVLRDSEGRERDSIYIKHPQNYAIQGYWRRSALESRQTGDLITFVRENLDSFSEAAGCRNETDGINRVLASLSGMAVSEQDLIRRFAEDNKGWKARPFSPDRWEREKGNVRQAMRFLSLRKISQDTAELFKDSFEIVTDKEKEKKYKNLAFPYRVPGDDRIVGYELRGFGNFKSKAEGTDSSNGCWMAYLGKQGYTGYITELHIAESALDIMAYVQLMQHCLDLDKCLFVSFGGSFNTGQLRGLLDAFPGAVPVLHFDNDLNGHMYDCRAAAVMYGKDLRCSVTQKDGCQTVLLTLGEKQMALPVADFRYQTFRQASGLRETLRVEKAPEPFKDWNDVIMNEPGQKAGEKEEAQWKWMGR
jgi:hypothetical protein